MEKQKKQKILKDYLQGQINPIFEKLVVDLLIDKPVNIVEYSMNWFENKGRLIEKAHNSNKSANAKNEAVIIELIDDTNQNFYRDQQKTENKSDDEEEYSQKKKPKRYQDDQDEEEEDEEDEEDYDEEAFFELKVQSPTKPKTRKTAVCAEVYGVFNQRSDYKPKLVPKTQDQRDRIQKTLIQSFMFQNLDQSDQKHIIDAMEEKVFRANQRVIQQGDDGQTLFLVASGSLDCFRKSASDKEEVLIKTYLPGESFGELALLYNAPRSATLLAKEDTILFCLDRETFNHFIKEGAVKRQERYNESLHHLFFIQQLDQMDKNYLFEGITEIQLGNNDVVLKEGQSADKIFIVNSGEVEVVQVQTNKIVKKFTSGQYFGEVGDFKNIPDQVNLIAKGHVGIIYIDLNKMKGIKPKIAKLLLDNN